MFLNGITIASLDYFDDVL